MSFVVRLSISQRLVYTTILSEIIMATIRREYYYNINNCAKNVRTIITQCLEKFMLVAFTRVSQDTHYHSNQGTEK